MSEEHKFVTKAMIFQHVHCLIIRLRRSQLLVEMCPYLNVHVR